jgi:Zinc dependent phospholipase C
MNPNHLQAKIGHCKDLIRKTVFVLLLIAVFIPMSAFSWGNGPRSGGSLTKDQSRCDNPPYSTHDWIAEHALMLLPRQERNWLEIQKIAFLLGTEAPDNNEIPRACNTPSKGYKDNWSHNVEWNEGVTRYVVRNGKLKDNAGRRAQQEYDKAKLAYLRGNKRAAAFYLGAMAHFIGDLSVFCHVGKLDDHHERYEKWVQKMTLEYNAGHFENYLNPDGLVERHPYTAIKRVSKVITSGRGTVLSAIDMDSGFNRREQNPAYKKSIGYSLNLSVNELADVLHTFYITVVSGRR